MVNCIKRLQIKLGIRRPPFPENRVVPVGNVAKSSFVSEPWSLDKLYGDNTINTSRYKWYSFVFQNLEEQAQRIANFYFLCIAIVQLFTDTPVPPITSILPLVFVILLTMVKQGYEDFLRLKADREVNNAPVQVIGEDGELETLKAWEIKVGDVVLVQRNETFPCDLILLSSSETTGVCFVTTASLDGETNLKPFTALSATKLYDTPDLISKHVDGIVTCQQPVDDFYKFVGKVEFKKPDGTTDTLPLSPECLLLRGARLRNTDFIYGCAIYTGPDTKMSLNSKGKQIKYSQIERKLNSFLVFFLGILLVISVLYTVLQYVLRQPEAWYVSLNNIQPWLVVQEFLGFLVLFNYIIPISLYVTIEFQKFFGSMFFEWDVKMYDEDTDQPAHVNTSDILEELGQVQYLFTDKTGTLTENAMEFQRFSVAAGTYLARDGLIWPVTSVRVSHICDIQSPRTSGRGHHAVDMPPSALNLFLVLALCHTVRVEASTDEVTETHNTMPKSITDISLSLDKTKDKLKAFKKKKKAPQRQSSVMRRFSAMQCAEEAVKNVSEGKQIDGSGKNYDYQASSPDEKAFVESCRAYGVVFHGIDKYGLQVVTVHGAAAMRYRVLDVLEFDSDRKCMSVVLQYVADPEDSSTKLDQNAHVIVLCKGAETSMLPRAGQTNDMKTVEPSGDLLIDGMFIESRPACVALSPNFIMDRVTDFASAGLRTLVMGARLLTATEWIQLKIALDGARGRLEGRDAAIRDAYRAVEKNLMLIGCTGIEDKLQDGVAQTLLDLREAGIQVWVLTGDKEETAVNISFSAGHFSPGLPTRCVTKQTSLEACMQTLKTELERIKDSLAVDSKYKFGLVIDGQSVNYTLSSALREQLLSICSKAEAVLCCRLTPIQKAEIVRLIKESSNPSPVCCAIGDGANDVSMIQEAHVGIGLFGKEGRQAARSADYALARFRFLKRVLLFHGYHYYVRTATLVEYFFYKNLVFTFTQVLFGTMSKFSCQTVYPNLYLLIYNITMTSFPIIFFGIFEQRLPEDVLISRPAIYKTMTRNKLMSWKQFSLWFAWSIWHTLVIFFGIYFLASEGVSYGGATGSAIGSLSAFGSFMINAVFILVTVKLILVSYHWNLFLIISCVLTLVVNFCIFILANYVSLPMGIGGALVGVWTQLSRGPDAAIHYLGLFCILVICLVPDIVYRLAKDQNYKLTLPFMPGADSKSKLLHTSQSNDDASAVNGAYYGSNCFREAFKAVCKVGGMSKSQERKAKVLGIPKMSRGKAKPKKMFGAYRLSGIFLRTLSNVFESDDNSAENRVVDPSHPRGQNQLFTFLPGIENSAELRSFDRDHQSDALSHITTFDPHSELAKQLPTSLQKHPESFNSAPPVHDPARTSIYVVPRPSSSADYRRTSPQTYLANEIK